MKTLAEQLVRPHLERRANNQRLPRDLKIALSQTLKTETSLPILPGPSNTEERLTVGTTCSSCDPKKKRKTKYICIECKNPIYIECSNKLCVDCREKWLF